MASRNFNKLQVTKLTSNFREAASIVEAPLPSVGSNEVLIKVYFTGVNATDINFSAGRFYTDGNLPFDIGFEVGLI